MDSEIVDIWRVQRRDGGGPYVSFNMFVPPPWRYNNNIHSRGRHVHSNCPCHPGPIADALTIHIAKPGTLFGFPTVHTALTWFQGWEKELGEYGFMLFRFRGTNKQMGQSGLQCTFIPTDDPPVVEVDFSTWAPQQEKIELPRPVVDDTHPLEQGLVGAWAILKLELEKML